MRVIVPIVLVVVSVSMYVCGVHYGMGCGVEGALLWPVCHVNVWHLLGNCIAANSIVRSDFRDKMWMWIVGYAVCVSIGFISQNTEETQGMSGVLYFVMGAISWQAARIKVFHAIAVACMCVGFFFPSVINNAVHFGCYACGVFAGRIGIMIEIRRIGRMWMKIKGW